MVQYQMSDPQAQPEVMNHELLTPVDHHVYSLVCDSIKVYKMSSATPVAAKAILTTLIQCLPAVVCLLLVLVL